MKVYFLFFNCFSFHNKENVLLVLIIKGAFGEEGPKRKERREKMVLLRKIRAYL